VVVHEHVQQLVLIERVELIDHRGGGCRSAATVTVGPVAHHASIAPTGVCVVADTPKSDVARRTGVRLVNIRGTGRILERRNLVALSGARLPISRLACGRGLPAGVGGCACPPLGSGSAGPGVVRGSHARISGNTRGARPIPLDQHVQPDVDDCRDKGRP
jgi:hypothetical protein